MPHIRIAVALESLNMPLRHAIDQAAALGVAGVQIDAVGDLFPDRLGDTGRRDFRNLLRSRGLEVSAVGCPLRHGLNVQENLEGRIAHVKKVLTLAYDLGPHVAVAYPGSLPAEPTDPLRLLLIHTLTDLGRHSDRIGTTLGLEIGAEPPKRWAECLQSITTGGLGISLDPATLLGYGHDPVASIAEVGALLRHVVARDRVPGRPDRGADEVVVGHGAIDWSAFLGALEEVGYRGWLTIRRGPAKDPVGDVRAAVTFLKRLVG